MNIPTIASEWQQYYDEVLKPAGVGAIQLQETRRAWYMGAYQMLCLLKTIADDPELTEDAQCKMMDRFVSEFDGFHSRIGNGV